MKILFVCHYTLPHHGGVEVVVDRLSALMAERGHSVKVVSSRVHEPAHERLWNREIIRVKAWNILERFGVPYPLFFPQLLPALVWAVRWADIVHVHGYLYQNSVLALWLANVMDKPTVLTEHVGFVHYPQPMWNALQRVAVRTLGKLALALSDAVIVYNTQVRKMMECLVGQQKPIVDIPNGVDTDLFHPATPEEKCRLRRELNWNERPKVLFVGRFVAKKGIYVLLAAANECYDLVLCGRGELPKALPKTTIIYPPMPQAELVRLYQAADVFTLPSFSEGFPLTVQEAMACGLPVVITYDPAYLQHVSPDVVRFTEASPSALREAITELVKDAQKREELGRRAAKWARTHFSWDRCVEQHLALYEQLTRGEG